MNILIVDDKPNIARVTTLALRTLGYQSFTAFTGSEAMHLLYSEKIDAILLDLNLGGENGLDLISRLSGRVARLPIILFTSHTKDEIADDIIKSGAVDCLVKPYSLDDLRQVLGRIEEHRLNPPPDKP